MATGIFPPAYEWWYNQGPDATGGTPNSFASRVGGGTQNAPSAARTPTTTTAPRRLPRGGGAWMDPNAYRQQVWSGTLQPPTLPPVSIPEPQIPTQPPAQQPPQTSPSTGSPLATYDTGINSGRLPDSIIQQAQAALANSMRQPLTIPQSLMAPNSGQPITGGIFGDMMGQAQNRANIDLSRAAAEQQAQMELAYQVANANSGIGMATLLNNLYRNDVTNQVNTGRANIGNLAALLASLGLF